MSLNWDRTPDSDDYVGCLGCAHRRAGRRLYCAAYPDGIPFPIFSGQVDHLVPRPGQVGDIVFVPFDVEVFKATRRRVPARDSEPATRAG